jgi:hypothetical protein
MSNLKVLAAKAVTTGFKILKEFITDVTLLSNPVQAYNKEIGKNAITFTEIPNVQGLQTLFEESEIIGSAGAILSTDIRMLLQGSQIPGDITTEWQVRIGQVLYEIKPPLAKNISGTSVILQLRKL